ncbi:MAG: hypothetical protein LBF97_06400 [Elusimicrobiota bacterium]|jgi:hypothetical protein|nr:hypothetical protein [Elusimicrobiota bacterium]
MELKKKEFVIDNHKASHQLIPEAQLRTGKDLTYPIEQDNSNTRHYIGKFKRCAQKQPQDASRRWTSPTSPLSFSTWKSFGMYAI